MQAEVRRDCRTAPVDRDLHDRRTRAWTAVLMAGGIERPRRRSLSRVDGHTSVWCSPMRCQAAPGLKPGTLSETTLYPSISQTRGVPLVFCHAMSAFPSPLKSAAE